MTGFSGSSLESLSYLGIRCYDSRMKNGNKEVAYERWI